MRTQTCGRCRAHKTINQFTIKADKRICDSCAESTIENAQLKKLELECKANGTPMITQTFTNFAKTPQAKRERERREKKEAILASIALKKEIEDYAS